MSMSSALPPADLFALIGVKKHLLFVDPIICLRDSLSRDIVLLMTLRARLVAIELMGLCESPSSQLSYF